jgi:hypothetical protein
MSKDKVYGSPDPRAIWNELTQKAEQLEGYDKMIGNTTSFVPVSPGVTVGGGTLYIPLQFWFCRNPGLALPLIALQYHEVKFNITFRRASDLYILAGTSPVIVGTPSLGNTSFYVDYVYLDTDERRQFAQVQHEYLIEQLQFTGDESFSSTAVKSKLSFNHPCKELVWVVQRDANVTAQQYFDYSTGSDAHHLVDAKLLLNGQDRFSTRQATYFGLVQPYQHHTRSPSTGIYCYSFAVNPEDHQPSGSVNMSRIDNATLQLTLVSSAACKLRVYAINYNVLRVMSGMGSKKLPINRCKSISKKQKVFFATILNCGKFLRALTTIFIEKSLKRTRLIIVPNGKNVKDWIIRSQVPIKMETVQRLNRIGKYFVYFLRYSLILGENQGSKWVLLTHLKKDVKKLKLKFRFRIITLNIIL